MFTGIIRHQGTVTAVDTKPDGVYISVATKLGTEVAEGDSVAVNGACLTVLEYTPESITFRLMQETLDKTSLEGVAKGSTLNLERPVMAGERFDGHFVLGHVDGTAEVTDIAHAGDDRVFTFKPDRSLLPYIVSKGSITIDGVSLTVVTATNETFTVSIMPYTLEHTNLGTVEVGDRVNLEADMIAKHVERIVATR